MATIHSKKENTPFAPSSGRQLGYGGLGADFLAIAAGPVFKFDDPCLNRLRADHHLPGQTDQVHIGELGPGAGITVIQQHLNACVLKLPV